jgi:hypothetical protein
MFFLEHRTNRIALLGWAVAVLLMVCSSSTGAQAAPLPPSELVRKTVQNELRAGTDSSDSYLFRSRKETPRGSQTKLMVQTRDATVGMVVANNDQPLSADQQAAEKGRLQYIATHPEELRRKQKQEKDDADRVTRIMRAMPDAFLYEPDGEETGKPGVGKPGDELIRLKFRPNPNYNPPSRVEQVLTGMQGTILIDSGRQRIARIDGMLFRDVSFGWGILGHLDRGGRFQVDQGTAAGDDSWEMTRMSLDLTGKILWFKSVAIKSTETFSDFRRVPSTLSFAEGVTLLEKEAAPNGNQSGGR